MNAPETSRRRFDLPAILLLAFAAVVACFVAWKWSRAALREQCLSDLSGKSHSTSSYWKTWSSEWPFYDVETFSKIELIDGTFEDDDVRRLRQAFPGVPIYHGVIGMGDNAPNPDDLVKLPED